MDSFVIQWMVLMPLVGAEWGIGTSFNYSKNWLKGVRCQSTQAHSVLAWKDLIKIVPLLETGHLGDG